MTRSRFTRSSCLIAVLALLHSGMGVQPADAEEAEVGAKMLISGHSLVDNPLADWIERIVRSKGGSLEWEEQIVIGSPVRVRTWGNGDWEGYRDGKNRHGEKLDIAKELRQPKDGVPYDILVLAENHSVIDNLMWENSVGYLRHFHDRLTDGNPRGRTYYFHSWLGLDKSDPSGWIDHETNAAVVWQCAAERVNLSLRDEGRPPAIEVLPAGEGLVELVRRDVPGLEGAVRQKLDRIFSDDVHLTETGVYFLAALHYGVIFGHSPEGAVAPAKTPPKLAASLQEIAWDVARQHRLRSSGKAPDMATCRKEIASKACDSYSALKGTPDEVINCRNYFSTTTAAPDAGVTAPGANPFVWPDPDWTPLPAPATR